MTLVAHVTTWNRQAKRVDLETLKSAPSAMFIEFIKEWIGSYLIEERQMKNESRK